MYEEATIKQVSEGWAKPIGCVGNHYFKNNRSLCGKWLFFGEIFDVNQKFDLHPSDCLKCANKVLIPKGYHELKKADKDALRWHESLKPDKKRTQLDIVGGLLWAE